MIARVSACMIVIAVALGGSSIASANVIDAPAPKRDAPIEATDDANADASPDEPTSDRAESDETETPDASPTDRVTDADRPADEAASPENTDETPPAAVTNPPPSRKAPPPSSVRHLPTRVAVGVGLSPEAPGTKAERALLDRLERTLAASKDPIAELRHVSAGAGEPQLICRERRDDLVVMIGYLPERNDPVVIAHDCRLDRSLGVRSAAAADEPELLATLWREHDDLVRQGVRERRTVRRLSPTARGVIIASVAVAVVGVAVGVLVANALRKERVVITVSP